MRTNNFVITLSQGQVPHCLRLTRADRAVDVEHWPRQCPRHVAQVESAIVSQGKWAVLWKEGWEATASWSSAMPQDHGRSGGVILELHILRAMIIARL